MDPERKAELLALARDAAQRIELAQAEILAANHVRAAAIAELSETMTRRSLGLELGVSPMRIQQLVDGAAITKASKSTRRKRA